MTRHQHTYDCQSDKTFYDQESCTSFVKNTPTTARPITLWHVAANQSRSTTLLYVKGYPSH